MTMLFAFALGLDRLTVTRVVGLAVAFGGVAIVVGLGSGSELSLSSAKGPLIVLGAPLAFALYNVILKPLLSRYDLLALTAAASLIGIVGLVPFARGSTVDTVVDATAAEVALLAYLGVLATLLGYILWNVGLKGIGPTRAVSYLYAISPLAVFIGTVILDEPLTPWLVIGGGPRRRRDRSGSGCLVSASLGYGRPMAGRTLSQRDLNRALLARQLLLERVRLPIPRALERLGGIQDQYAPNAYIRLWSCLEGFRRDDLTRALGRRSVVQATLLRATIHVVSRRDYWPFAVAIRAPQRDWWLRTRRPRPAERELERQAEKLRALMAGGPRRQEELVEVVGRSWGMVGAVARPRPRPAVGNVGEAPRAPVSDRRALGRAGGRRSRLGARPPRSPLPCRVRPGTPSGTSRSGRG